jgi:hypothetical protein
MQKNAEWTAQAPSGDRKGNQLNLIAGLGNKLTSGLSVTAWRGGTISLGGELRGLGLHLQIWTGNAVPF